MFVSARLQMIKHYNYQNNLGGIESSNYSVLLKYHLPHLPGKGFLFPHPLLHEHKLTKLISLIWSFSIQLKMWKIIYLNWGERYEDMIDCCSYKARPHESGYFWICKFFFPDSKIYPSTCSVFKSNSPVHRYPKVSGFNLVSWAPLQ